jgi:hypothetical protein
MTVNTIGRWLLLIGLGVAAVGGLIFLASKIPGLDRLGRLPGDIRWQSADGRLSCLVPVVSSILISIILTIALNLVIRLLNR